jgi:serine/threonine-protein kinase RsbW
MTSTSATLPTTEDHTCVTVRSLADLPRVVDPLIDEMRRLQYPGPDVFAVRLAVEEALVNAVEHGNRGDPSKQVEVRYQVTAQRVLVEVEDEGPGFDPGDVADPLSPEGLTRTGGRGLHLMRCCMTSVRFNERGNAVTLCKERGEPASRTGRPLTPPISRGDDQ